MRLYRGKDDKGRCDVIVLLYEESVAFECVDTKYFLAVSIYQSIVVF